MSNESSYFRKIVRVRSSDYVVLDEFAYYEALYGDIAPNRIFYEIASPFRMDSEVVALSKRGCTANENKSKRKRKHWTFSNITDDLRKVSLHLGKILARALSDGAFRRDQCWMATSSSSEISLDFNNRRARLLATTLAAVPCPLSRLEPFSCLERYSEKRNIREVFLDQHNRSIDLFSNDLILWTNAEPNVLIAQCKGENYILPPHSSFVVNDARSSMALVKGKKQFDFILIDPPWENKSVNRKRIYPTYGELTWLLDLCIPELIMETGLLAVWVTNNARFLQFTDELIEYFGFEKIVTWRWLKVTTDGEPVYSLNSQHKQPFESIVFASNDTVSKLYKEKMINNFVLISSSCFFPSTPSTIHSRKPPLLPIMQVLGILDESAIQLELFGRYLLPHTTTIGYEAARLQNKRYFI